MASEILDMAMGSIFQEACDKVMGELEQPEEEERFQPHLNIEDEAKGGGMVEEKVVQAAVIKEVVITPQRASERLARIGGLHSVEKAKKRKAWKNLELPTESEMVRLNNKVVANKDNLAYFEEVELDEIK
ncbi:hypothetical protein E2562_024035 [Oryza meyeriana var. granulata]|uniref:Uncharacterized protein n=1 Tax=Oryza meyeriana var. granulata TaxID=110450 RepID=A0A6G1CTY5_9ORYZ|nr:hypothetical protein E2562_024035 [Oryza meyeriana var. granulata]